MCGRRERDRKYICFLSLCSAGGEVPPGPGTVSCVMREKRQYGML